MGSNKFVVANISKMTFSLNLKVQKKINLRKLNKKGTQVNQIRQDFMELFQLSRHQMITLGRQERKEKTPLSTSSLISPSNPIKATIY